MSTLHNLANILHKAQGHTSAETKLPIDVGGEVAAIRREYNGLREENERLTTELRLVRKAARDFLATLDDSPARTLLKAAIFE